MLRYIVLILLIVIVILLLVNMIFTKILKTLTKLGVNAPTKKIYEEKEVLYKDNDVIVLKGESKSKQKDRRDNEQS